MPSAKGVWASRISSHLTLSWARIGRGILPQQLNVTQALLGLEKSLKDVQDQEARLRENVSKVEGKMEAQLSMANNNHAAVVSELQKQKDFTQKNFAQFNMLAKTVLSQLGTAQQGIYHAQQGIEFLNRACLTNNTAPSSDPLSEMNRQLEMPSPNGDASKKQKQHHQ